jgi:uncharacterized protein YdiU (UPF0061 family)
MDQTQRQTQMRQHNPLIVLRNYLVQQVIGKAEEGDFDMFRQLLDALKKPYEAIDMYQKCSLPPPGWGKN